MKFHLRAALGCLLWFAALSASALQVASPDGAGYSQSYAAFRARVLDGLARLCAALDRDAAALVVTSGGPIAVLAAELLGVPTDAGFRLRFGLANCGLTRIVVTRTGPRLSSFNELGHLERALGSLFTLR